MPARRNPKKSRKPRPEQSAAELAPVDLDALTVAPASVPSLPSVEVPPPPKAGPPVRGAVRNPGGRSQAAGQARRYAFRRS